MVVKIRLARFGRTNAPFYNIVVAHARTARNSRPLEVIGTYDPIPRSDSYRTGRKHKNIELDRSRAMFWIGVGAQPTEPMRRLLSYTGITEAKYRPRLTHLTEEKQAEIEKEQEAKAQQQLARRVEARRAEIEPKEKARMAKIVQDEADEERRLAPQGQEQEGGTPDDVQGREGVDKVKAMKSSLVAAEKARNKAEAHARRIAENRRIKAEGKAQFMQRRVNKIKTLAQNKLDYLHAVFLPAKFKYLGVIIGPEKAAVVEKAYYARVTGAPHDKIKAVAALPKEHLFRRVENDLNYMQLRFIPDLFHDLADIVGPQKAAELEDAHYRQEGSGPKRTWIEARTLYITMKVQWSVKKQNMRHIPVIVRHISRFIKAHLKYVRGSFTQDIFEELKTIIGPQKKAELEHAHSQRQATGSHKTKSPRWRDLESTVARVTEKVEAVIYYQNWNMRWVFWKKRLPSFITAHLHHLRQTVLPAIFEELHAVIGPQKAAEVRDAYDQSWRIGPDPRGMGQKAAKITRRAEATLHYQNRSVVPEVLSAIQGFQDPQPAVEVDGTEQAAEQESPAPPGDAAEPERAAGPESADTKP